MGVDRLGDRPIFSLGTTEPYIAFFDEATGQFVREKALDVVGIDPVQTGGIQVGAGNRLFVGWGREAVIFDRRSDGSWAVDRQTLSRFGRNGDIGYSYCEPRRGLVAQLEPGPAGPVRHLQDRTAHSEVPRPHPPA